MYYCVYAGGPGQRDVLCGVRHGDRPQEVIRRRGEECKKINYFRI